MIGRSAEITRMRGLLDSKRSEFVAVTGRRRIGKTFLIDFLLKEHYCFSMTGIQHADMSAQLVNFGVKLEEYSKISRPKPRNWQAAFLQLKDHLATLDPGQKQVIFIDELPWIASPRSGFIQLLAHFWNDYLSKEKHFILVICGSATSWITRRVLNDAGGLHNRVTETIHLQPFSLAEAGQFLLEKGIKLSEQDMARTYMALGGVPFYLEKIRKGESFPVAIERICFSPEGPLKDEHGNLYQALFNNAHLHEKIVSTLTAHPNGMSHEDILKSMGAKKGGSYQRAMLELTASGFVVENRPFGKKKRGSLYRLADEYSIFYHRFIRPNSKYSPGIWQQLAMSQSYKIWAGYAFESLCHKHIASIKEALGIRAVYTEISSLRVPDSQDGRGFQIDLLIDRKDDTINICEIKFHGGPFQITKEYYEELIEKRQRFIEFTGTKKQIFLTFITNHGVRMNDYATEIVDAEVRLEAFF
ncbi:MAG: AAA family ATPase [Bacteroidia bacterium]|nr:AAA family ATPase [Bacteroidia bacterium]